jgi:hypothetical protein
MALGDRSPQGYLKSKNSFSASAKCGLFWSLLTVVGTNARAYLHIPRFSGDLSRSISHADHGLWKPFHNYTWQDHKAQDCCCVVRTQQIQVVAPRSRKTFMGRQGGQTRRMLNIPHRPPQTIAAMSVQQAHQEPTTTPPANFTQQPLIPPPPIRNRGLWSKTFFKRLRTGAAVRPLQVPSCVTSWLLVCILV